MSETNAQEPTMEEILASIRRIISEDDAPGAAAPEAAAEAEADDGAEVALAPEPAAPPPAAPLALAEGDDDDVLELTEPVAAEPAPAPVAAAPVPAPAAAAPAVESVGDLDVAPRAAPAPPAAPAAAPAASFAAYERPEDEEAPAAGLAGAPTVDHAASMFGHLSRTVAMPTEGRNLEDVVRELLRPLLKDWLDKNLSGIVESAVQAEVERIARLRRF